MSKEDKMIELLEELVKWTKVASVPKVKELLLGILESPEEILAYHLSDGEKSGRDIAERTNVTQPTIGKWWKKWIAAGIAEPISVQRGERAKRIFSLEDFGIEVPQIVKASPTSEGGMVSAKQEDNAGTS
jgi:DNA-binding MarR family transcriptional regulator